jgi:GTPase SAR1 family protein
MGCVSGKGPDDPHVQAKKITAGYDREFKKEKKKAKRVIKLLFLGPGGSGKSTIFKQMQQLYGAGFQKEDRAFFATVIFFNLLRCMFDVVRQMGDGIPEDLREAQEAMLTFDIRTQINHHEQVAGPFHALAPHVKTLWDSEEVREAYARDYRFGLRSEQYFFDKLEQVSEIGWEPSLDDIFHARVKTTGINEYKFELDRYIFVCTDVGGQRSERKKWIHCFQGVTAVLFVAALDSFDIVLEEDPDTNGLVEALTLWEFVTNLDWFKESGLILFLNKIDRFEAKIGVTSRLSAYFPSYTGPETFQAAREWLRQLFQGKTRHKCYAHFTLATSTANISQVFHDVRAIILQQHLHSSGLS